MRQEAPRVQVQTEKEESEISQPPSTLWLPRSGLPSVPLVPAIVLAPINALARVLVSFVAERRLRAGHPGGGGETKRSSRIIRLCMSEDGTAAPPPQPQAPTVVDYRIPQTMDAEAIPTAVSWTGGKDCNLTLLHAARNPRLRVVCLVVFRPKDAKFQAHPIPSWRRKRRARMPLVHVE